MHSLTRSVSQPASRFETEQVEELITDSRSALTPSQRVDQKLADRTASGTTPRVRTNQYPRRAK